MFGRPAAGCFFRRRRCAHRVKPAAGEVSRVTTEICAAKEDCQSVDRDKPNRKRLGADARFAFFALNGSVHLLDVGLLAIIHSLADARWRFWFFVHCIVILQELVTPVLAIRLLARALPVRLRLISLRSPDAID